MSKDLYVFVPQDGKYVEIEDYPDNLSANEIAKSLGYSQHMFYSYTAPSSDYKRILSVMFKSLTSDIIAVIATKEVPVLSEEELSNYLSDYSYKNECDDYKINGILKDAVEDKSFTLQFVCDALGLDYEKAAVAPYIEDSVNGYRYYFENGFMSSYESLDVFGEWARYYKEKNPLLFLELYSYAKDYWGNDEDKVINEVDKQCEALSNIPQGLCNEILPLFHLSGQYNYNFMILRAACYNGPLSLQELKDFSHGECQFMNIKDDSGNYMQLYLYNKFAFLFDEEQKCIFTKFMDI